jgi:hypothetical protein
MSAFIAWAVHPWATLCGPIARERLSRAGFPTFSSPEIDPF